MEGFATRLKGAKTSNQLEAIRWEIEKEENNIMKEEVKKKILIMLKC
jgi:hypothetical protein